MKTALLAQNEALAARDYQPNHDSSVLPLSHSVQYPVDVDGAILPCCVIEVNPHESYLISNEILLRQLQPLKVPQMTRYTLVTAYYYCSNRLGWKKWSMFANQADKGRPDINYSFELPRMANAFCSTDLSDRAYSVFDKLTYNSDNGSTYTLNINYQNSLHTYLDISMNRKGTSYQVSDDIDDTDDLPLAFPMFDYQMICRDFYTNIDRIPDSPDLSNVYNFDNPFSDWSFSNLFPVDEDEIKLVDGVNINSGYHSGDDSQENFTGFVLDKVRYHDFRPDYFTSSKRAPMRGEAPTVDTTIAVSKIDASDVFAEPKESQLPISDYFLGVTDSNQVDPDWTNKFVAGESWKSPDPIRQDSQSLSPRVAAQAAAKEAFEKLKVDLTVSKSITCAQIMLMTQLTLWKTLNMLSKPTYNDFLNAHFGGVKVGDSLAEAPQYIGGTSQVIDVNEVLQTSADSGTQKLGNQAAVAHSYSNSYVGKFFAQDFGFIIGVMFIIPDIVYRPAMPRWASRRTIEEYYFPEFANLSMQATLNKELFYSNDKDWNNQALGYVGAYDELRSIPNYCAGR